MSSVILKCDCQVTEEGQFIVSERCANCKECNLVSSIHPFTDKRL